MPQHLLLMATVLRYIMRQTDLLRKPELDSFLITAFSPELMDADYLARSKLDLITPRGVQLATLFMEGVEMALLANDACGAPVPFLMCCPWLFFDGQLVLQMYLVAILFCRQALPFKAASRCERIKPAGNVRSQDGLGCQGGKDAQSHSGELFDVDTFTF